MPVNTPLPDKLTPKKWLGQNFLHDRRVLERIAGLCVPAPNAPPLVGLLEIGPGEGALTAYLLRIGPPLTSVELDADAVVFLQHRFATEPHFTLLHRDILTNAPPSGAPWLAVGNLPYNISSPFFFWLLQHRAQFPRGVFMVQHEVAERLAAPPGNKTFGILSVLLGCYYAVKYEFKVAPGAFRPPPNVHSAVVSLTRLPGPEPAVDFQYIRTVTKAAFGQRRKTLRNALKTIHLEPPSAMAEQRAEQLPISAFVQLAELFAQQSLSTDHTPHSEPDPDTLC
jgi:16S rRNA (adenine1518-N6/adenine1519-N6)-dimethyltransferase